MRLIPKSTGRAPLSSSRFFDTLCLLISVNEKLSLKPSLHVWRCVEDETGQTEQKSLRYVAASYINVYMLLRFRPLGEEDERSPDADSLKG